MEHPGFDGRPTDTASTAPRSARKHARTRTGRAARAGKIGPDLRRSTRADRRGHAAEWSGGVIGGIHPVSAGSRFLSQVWVSKEICRQIAVAGREFAASESRVVGDPWQLAASLTELTSGCSIDRVRVAVEGDHSRRRYPGTLAQVRHDPCGKVRTRSGLISFAANDIADVEVAVPNRFNYDFIDLTVALASTVRVCSGKPGSTVTWCG